MQQIGIRADGNGVTGMGHLMRCISVAAACAKVGIRPIFFTADEDGAAVVKQWGLDCEVLGTDYTRMEEETELLACKMRQRGLKLLLVDSYHVTQAYFESMKQVGSVFYIDDMGEAFFPVQGVINYNIYGEDIPYRRRYREDTILLLGSRFAPVREEFLQVPYSLKEKVERILITMGGSDSLNIAGVLAERLLKENKLENITLEIVCGKFNPNLVQLQKTAEENKKVHVHSDVNDMAKLMSDCDMAVSAAGSTMYELCAVGVPSICCYYVDNQRQIAEGFAEQTKVINAGNYAGNPQKVVTDMVLHVINMIQSRASRMAVSESMKAVADGHGAERIACCIKEYLEKR